jgi:hypothetical protein
MSANLPNEYQNNFDANKNYVESLHFPGRGLAAYEVNEVLTMYDNKRLEVAKAIFQEGDIIGSSPVVNNATGGTIIPAGKIFARNEIIIYPEQTFVIPIDRPIKLGVFIQEVVVSGGTNVSNNEDPELLDPSANINPGKFYATSNQETSKRLKLNIQWGWKDAIGGQTPGAVGVFYEVYDVDNGILILAPAATSRSGIIEEIARYDRDVNGSYIVRGFEVDFDYENADRDAYYLDIKSGVANVNGFKISRTANDRFELPIDPDTRLVSNDPDVLNIETLTFTETLEKGTANGQDLLGRPDVQSIVEITSEDGFTTYVDGVDYQLNGNSVDWSLGGAEPATSDNYIVTYTFLGAEVQVDKAPLNDVTGIVAPLEITDENVIRGSVANTADTTANSPIVSIINVKQGATTFTQGVDYQLTGSTVDWSLGGAEPAPNSSYTVTYRYNKVILPDEGSISSDTFTITNQGIDGDIVDGSTVLVTYNFRLKRIDLLELAQNGLLRRIKGVSQERFPNQPEGSSDAIPLARIELDWENAPRITELFNIAIKQGELNAMKNRLFTQGVLLAEMKLELNASLDGASNAGIFAEAFVDIDKSDLGKPQTLLITDDQLTIPLDTVIGSPDQSALVQTFQTLDSTDEVIVEQSQRTAVMRINPYATFEVARPVEIDSKIDNQVDDFTDRTMAQSSNPDPFSWTKNPVNTTIVDTIVEPPVLTVADRMTLTGLRDIVKDAKGIEKLKPKGVKKTLNIIAKLNAGETLGNVKIGSIVVDTATGAVVKNKRK